MKRTPQSGVENRSSPALARIGSKTYGTVSADRQKEMSGLEFVQGLVDGTLPLNLLAQTLGYDVTEAASGRVVVTVKPSDAHLLLPSVFGLPEDGSTWLRCGYTFQWWLIWIAPSTTVPRFLCYTVLMDEKYTLQLKAGGEHPEVFIPELGVTVPATGTSRDEVVEAGQRAIVEHLLSKKRKIRRKTASRQAQAS